MRPKIFFVHGANETFVKLDREILSGLGEVYDFFAPHKFPVEINRYWHGVKTADIVFCWFASWNSFWTLLIAKLFQKPSILVIGGYDLANIPVANYGHQRGGLKKWISRAAMKLATELFTNSYYSQREAEQNAGIPSERVKVIHHGVPDPFGSLPKTPKEQMVLTVGRVDWSNLKRKGLESFVRSALFLPDIQFILVGAWMDDSIDHLRSIAPSNVIFSGQVDGDELLDYYRRASVYLQASLHEGFGMSVAEAMLAGCIPVITKKGSLPEVVGESGFTITSLEPADIAEVIGLALKSQYSLREQARERILNLFPLDGRKKSIKEIIRSIHPANNNVHS